MKRLLNGLVLVTAFVGLLFVAFGLPILGAFFLVNGYRWEGGIFFFLWFLAFCYAVGEPE